MRTTLLFLALGATAFAQTQNKCAELAKFKMAGSTIEITRAEMVPARAAGGGRGGPAGGPGGAPAGPALPAHCRVDGILDKRTGPDGKTYGIKFAVAMPDNWTGQFVQQGGGGLNGTVGDPTGAQAAGDTPALARGMAVASSDTGHSSGGGRGGAFDGSFEQDQQAALDFEFIAIGRLTVLAKQVIETYYGRPVQHSYYVGCSTGGREAMTMSQKYPLYFDGIVAGSPAMRTGQSNLATKFITVQLNTVAPKDASGKAVTAQALSDGDKKAFVNKLLDVCDARDGVKDGMVFDPMGCSFRPKDLQCVGAKADGCLSADQVAAIDKAFAGPKDSRGNMVYSGWFYDTGITATGGGIPGILSGGNSPIGPSTTATTMDVDAEAAAVAANPSAILGDTWSWTNLNTFTSHGGKILFYAGTSDPWFSAKDTLWYFDRMGKANGGAAKANEFSRLYFVPGMGHCQGGAATLDQFDMLSASVNWVEKSQAPDQVVATGRAFPGRSRPLCSYPAHAQYKGSGDMEKAENFECKQ